LRFSKVSKSAFSQNGFGSIFIIPIVLLIGIIGYFYYQSQSPPVDTEVLPISSTPTATITPIPIFPYKPPQVEPRRSYLTLIVGDSMVDTLGTNIEPLRLKLIDYYPNNEFVNYNYGFGSTNIESLQQRLNEQTKYLDKTFVPILEVDFDLIIIGSFAYNPLSRLPLTEGLQKHRAILNETIPQIIKAHPSSVIAFLAPIAPSNTYFAKGVVDLTQEERQRWVKERVAYINNHIQYAKENTIPLINVYEKSLTTDGDGDLKYINPDDFIHPSKEGVDLTTQAIANFIFDNKIFPE